MVVDIEHVAISSAAAILHLSQPSSSSSGLKRSGAYTLEKLQASSSDVFQIVAPVALLSLIIVVRYAVLFLIIYIYLILNQNTPPPEVPLSVAQSSVYSEVSNTPTNIMLEDQSSNDEDIDHSLTGDHSSSVTVMPVEL